MLPELGYEQLEDIVDPTSAATKARLKCARSLSSGKCSISEKDLIPLGFPPSILPLYREEKRKGVNSTSLPSPNTYIGGLDEAALNFYTLVLAMAQVGTKGGIKEAQAAVGGAGRAGKFRCCWIICVLSNSHAGAERLRFTRGDLKELPDCTFAIAVRFGLQVFLVHSIS
jgi:hypothetical protein